MNKKQRQTLGRIFEKPDRSDIEWSDVEALFKALGGELSEGRGSRVRVALKDVRAVFHRPHPERRGIFADAAFSGCSVLLTEDRGDFSRLEPLSTSSGVRIVCLLDHDEQSINEALERESA